MDSTQQHFITAISTLRKCGFFEEYGGLTDADAAAALLEHLRQRTPQDSFYLEYPEHSWDKNLLNRVAEGISADTFKAIAVHDHTRIWAGDLEADVSEGSNVYADLIEEYALLSMGYLQPTNIEETWISETGPVTLSFEHQGQKFNTQLAYYDDWIDGEVFSFLDNAMESLGFSSAIHSEINTGQDVFIVRATAEEKACMERELGWSFDFSSLLNDESS
jgi:hypothetical protein